MGVRSLASQSQLLTAHKVFVSIVEVLWREKYPKFPETGGERVRVQFRYESMKTFAMFAVSRVNPFALVPIQILNCSAQPKLFLLWQRFALFFNWFVFVFFHLFHCF